MTDQHPRLLAIEASADACSVALLHQGVVCERNETEPRQHSQLLLPMVDELLQEASLALRDIDAIAFSAGPGSFTGLRLALGVAQGLAFGAELPLIAVSSLAALAQAVIEARALQEGAQVFCVVDARMGECYGGHYAVRDGRAEALAEDCLLPPEALADLPLSPESCVLVGNMSNHAVLACRSWAHIDVSIALGRHLLPQAVASWAVGEVVTAEAAQPVYLRGKSSWKSLKG